MKKLIFSLILGIFLISLISADSCTVTFDKETYVPNETVTASMVCTEQLERNKAYTLNWTFANGTEIELDTGTTPSVVGEHFLEKYIIPSMWPLNNYINATLQELS